MFSMLEAEAYKRGYEPGEGAFASALAWPRALDLYAGSGALGIEALSRGALHADLVDANPEARRAIVDNLRGTGLAERARILGITVEQALERLSGPYDLVLLDPPYSDPTVPKVLRRLAASSLVGLNSVIVLEHSQAFAPPSRLDGFRLDRIKEHGTTRISLYTCEGGR